MELSVEGFSVAGEKDKRQRGIGLYKTSDIAKRANIHPNTVRFYEQAGLISKPERMKNGYRLFTYKHLYQVLVLRCIFLDDWPGKNIRKASIKIIQAMRRWDLETARKYTEEYIKVIREEYEKATEAINILKRWSENCIVEESQETYNRSEAAALIGVTPETLRNWERNDLIHIPRFGKNQKRFYRKKEIDRLRIIYMLRQARYSISAIHHCLKKMDEGDIYEALNSLYCPDEDKVVWTGDHWLSVLEKTEVQAKQILKLLDEVDEKDFFSDP